MASLAARYVENARARRQANHVEKSGNFLAVALEREQRLVLEQILSVEIALPPLTPLRTLSHPIKIKPTLPCPPSYHGVCMSVDRRISRREAIKIGVGAGAALTLGGTNAFAARSSRQ